ncbi:hypothetical protein E2C01_025400 [Portunus trituberculatus]|uniref:Uncharacterized protein n=1 Tax=Portunus trituberculatus TaxID=210409 RepID=A0A5B7EFV3_PORTR|nr:hypothetical protein [Portunus trituberculatus]
MRGSDEERKTSIIVAVGVSGRGPGVRSAGTAGHPSPYIESSSSSSSSSSSPQIDPKVTRVAVVVTAVLLKGTAYSASV